MGRRKERRLAAISAAGRRVKLDLFAEPSGDVGGSSPKEEVGGDGDSKSHAKLPISPSSSGPQPVNPLLLLEQYSDDELECSSSERHNVAATEDACINIDDEGEIATNKETEHIENNHDKEEGPVGQHLDRSAKHEVRSIAEFDSDDLQKKTSEIEETTCLGAPDPAGDVSSCWKKVLHEESGQYYYWNIATSETSWKLPDGLAQASDMTTEKVIEDTERKVDAAIVPCKSSTSLDMEEVDMDTRKLFMTNTIDRADQGVKTDGSMEGIKDGSIEDEECDRETSQSCETSLPDRHNVESIGGARSSDPSFELIEHCESLLERLKSVKGLNDLPEGQDLKKYTVEIETRLADIKALASHGVSLHPFWLHSEGQIKRIEATVDGIVQINNSRTLVESGSALESHVGILDEIEIGPSEKKARFTLVDSHPECTFSKSNHEANNAGVATTGRVSTIKEMAGINEITRHTDGNQLSSRLTRHSIEDADMDVDMEVDDTSPVKCEGASDGHYSASTEPQNVHHTLGDQASLASAEVLGAAPPGQEWVPPPPPDDEPFPPPPPDDEPFPPPPPDEPPEFAYPPVSHLGSVQSLTYPEQYTLSYPGSNLGYYGQTTLQLPGTSPYTHPEAGQLAVTHLPHYYDAAANIYSVAPPVVEPTTYYGLQNGTLNSVPLGSGVLGSSGSTSETAPETVDSGTTGTMDYHPEGGFDLVLETNLSVAKSVDTMVKAPPEEAHFSTGYPLTASVVNGVSVSSTSETTTLIPTAAAAAAASSKSQSKVARGKKRTVSVVSTLKSNKKVSTLVDKWKAAKEELQEQEREEEPEDAYEFLERKRQREIEEWRAQQIASGVAKENANFQPLGGDWRERVKRKRAEKMKESKQSSPDVATDGNQKPDLVELSKGLPSGWQVYWDDSSKQVYYGNVQTLETTWTRPKD